MFLELNHYFDFVTELAETPPTFFFFFLENMAVPDDVGVLVIFPVWIPSSKLSVSFPNYSPK